MSNCDNCQSAHPDPAPTPCSLTLHETLSTLSSPLSDGGSADGASGTTSPSIGSFAVYATEAFEMNGNALVAGCGVGVEKTTGHDRMSIEKERWRSSAHGR